MSQQLHATGDTRTKEAFKLELPALLNRADFPGILVLLGLIFVGKRYTTTPRKCILLENFYTYDMQVCTFLVPLLLFIAVINPYSILNCILIHNLK